MHKGNVSAISTYMTPSGKHRILRCTQCTRSFSETRDTVVFALRTPAEKVMMALKMLLVKVDLAGICFVLDVTEETILGWLNRAAQKAHAINTLLVRDLPITQVQLDAMWHFMTRQHAHQADPDGESPEESADGRQWIWISFAPECRLILATGVGPRPFASAWQLIQMPAAIVVGIPSCFSDGFSCYLAALLEVYHPLKVFPSTGKRGRPTNPIQEPHPDLVYAPVIKQKQKGRLQALLSRVRCGAQQLEERGMKIGTSVLERRNLTLRQSLAPLVRKGSSVCKDREQRRRRVSFFQAFYNVGRPHMRLRVPLPGHAQLSTGLIRPKWTQRTPGMAAGLTDHIWTFRELLTVKFEPIHPQSISG